MSQQWEAFRFADDELQSSLVELLNEAKVEYIVADDKTLHYPPALGIECFINRIVDTFLGDSYYRTEISDATKAERYRRFKMHTGTPLVEENRSGEIYFVQPIFERIYRSRGVPTRVSFFLAKEDLNPTEVTTQLGIPPTFACSKGEPFARPYSGLRKDVPPGSSHCGWWELCSIPYITSNDIQLHLEWLLETLEPISSRLKDVKAKWPDVDCSVLQLYVVMSRRSLPEFSFPSVLLRRLSELVGRMDIWVYEDDFV